MSSVTVFVVTYGVTVAVALGALGLDAFGKRTSAIVLTGLGLVAAAVGGFAAALPGTNAAAVGPIEVGGPASLVYGVIALVCAASVLGGLDHLRLRPNGGSLAALVALAVAASGGAAAARDLTALVLCVETLAIASYALVAASRTSRSAEAAMKYFVQGALATAFLIFGLGILLGLVDPTGSYASLGAGLSRVSAPLFELAGVGLVLAALLFKVGAVPFHSWAPDAYETAPIEAAAFLGAGSKLAAVAAAAVFIGVLSGRGVAGPLIVVIAALAILSILVGSVAALRQRNYRRLLAYAGIAQAGYALIAIALSMAPLAVFFMATYALAATGTFLAAAAFERIRPEWDGSVAGLAGVGHQAPVVSGALSVLFLSLAGLPPFLGFWAKLVVFATAVTQATGSAEGVPGTSLWLLIAVAAGVLGSLVSVGYYGGILRVLYFDSAQASARESAHESGRAGGSAAVAVIVLAIAVFALGVVPLIMGPTSLLEIFVAG